MLYSVSFVQSKKKSHQNPGQNILERCFRVTHTVADAAEQQGRTVHLPPLATCPEAVTQQVKFLRDFSISGQYTVPFPFILLVVVHGLQPSSPGPLLFFVFAVSLSPIFSQH